MNGVGEEGSGEEYREESLNLFDSILARQPENLHAHFCRGIILNERDLHERARADFRFVVDKAPEDDHAWYWLGNSARKLDPTGVRPADERGVTTENLKEAIAAYRKALECNPSLNRHVTPWLSACGKPATVTDVSANSRSGSR